MEIRSLSEWITRVMALAGSSERALQLLCSSTLIEPLARLRQRQSNWPLPVVPATQILFLGKGISCTETPFYLCLQ